MIATATQVKDFFDMKAKDMLTEWRALTEEDRQFFRVEVGKFLMKEESDDNDQSV